MELNSLLILAFMNSGISLIMGFYLFFLKKKAFNYGPKYWALGAIIIGAGLFLKAIFPIGHSFAIIAYPIFLTVGLYIYLVGIWKFKGKKINKWIVIGLPILDILQTIIFLKIFHYHRIQLGLHLIFLVIYCVLGIIEMLRLNSSQKYLKKIFLLNAISYSIFLILILLNVYIIITKPDFNPYLINNTIVFIHIVSGLIMIALTFGFLSAVNIRLNMELEDQLKSKTKLLSIIGHDLRGPVGNIMNFSDLLQNKSNLKDSDRKKYLQMLISLSESTFHLLQNLLEWATTSKNLNKFDCEKIELSKLVSGNIIFFKSSAELKSIKLEFNEGKQTYILGNANMIETIVRNLISNAIKFTPKDGTITVTSEKILHKVRLTVSDTGKGIKPEIINSLFKFETNKSTKGTFGETGSGLGLVLCKELVSSNNGTLEIESTEGFGTKVIVEFPSTD